MSKSISDLKALMGQPPDEEREMAEEIMKAADGLAKYSINPARNVDEVLAEQDGDHALRPRTLDDVVGQEHIKPPLQIAMRAAKRRGEPLGHIALYGPPGLGKTTVASVVAREMETLMIMDTGPQLSANKLTYYGGEIIKAFNDENMRVTFFVDEAHGIPNDAINVLLPLLEDFRFLSAMHVPAFTFVMATTDPGKLPLAFTERFHYHYHVEYYSPDEIGLIVSRNLAKIWKIYVPPLAEDADDDAKAAHNEALGIHNEFMSRPEVQESIATISSRARGIPRTANRLIKHVHDYALGVPTDEEWDAKAVAPLNMDIVKQAMQANGIDKNGLTKAERAVLVAMVERFKDRTAVGLDAIASAIGENPQTVKLIIEPFLVRCGMINRGLRGREITQEGRQVAMMTLAGLIEY